MKILILLFLAALFSSCSGSGHDTVELDISYTLENGETCKTYLADHFLVTVYDDEQRKVIEKQIKCDSSDSDKITLFVEKGESRDVVGVVLVNLCQSLENAAVDLDSPYFALTEMKCRENVPAAADTDYSDF